MNYLLLTLLIFISLLSTAHSNDRIPKPLAFSPVVMANPVMDVAAGANVSYLYELDKDAPVSQLMGMGLYSTNDSYSGFLMNRLYTTDNKLRSLTGITTNKTNYEWEVEGSSDKAQNQMLATGFFQRFLFKTPAINEDLYLGFFLSYLQSNWESKNALGSIVEEERGLDKERNGLFGISAAYDTRDNFYFPYKGLFLEADIIGSSDKVISEDSFHWFNFNFRYFQQLESKDVLAYNLYGRYTSSSTPYTFLSQLGRQGQLRGFNTGEAYNQHMTNFQMDYRKYISEKIKVVAFAGMAYLSGKADYISADEGVQQLDSNMYYSGGVGFRYAIQSKNRVHFRFDYAWGSKVNGEQNSAFYVSAREAF